MPVDALIRKVLERIMHTFGTGISLDMRVKVISFYLKAIPDRDNKAYFLQEVEKQFSSRTNNLPKFEQHSYTLVEHI